MNQVTISAAEFIQLTNRIRELEDTLARIFILSNPTTEESSVDQKEVQG